MMDKEIELLEGALVVFSKGEPDGGRMTGGAYMDALDNYEATKPLVYAAARRELDRMKAGSVVVPDKATDVMKQAAIVYMGQYDDCLLPDDAEDIWDAMLKAAAKEKNDV